MLAHLKSLLPIPLSVLLLVGVFVTCFGPIAVPGDMAPGEETYYFVEWKQGCSLAQVPLGLVVASTLVALLLSVTVGLLVSSKTAGMTLSRQIVVTSLVVVVLAVLSVGISLLIYWLLLS